MKPARRVLSGIVIIAALATPAGADVAIDLRAPDPVAGLPAIAKNKGNFLRAFRRWRKGCTKPDISVESGAIEASVDEPQYTTMPLIGGCGEPLDEYAGNISAINASLSKTQCRPAPLRGEVVAKLPATFEAAGLRVEVTGNASSAHVTINKLADAGTWTGGRRMQTAIVPQEVHAWYIVDTGARRQLAVLLSGKEADGTISERWMEVWAKKAGQASAPIDVARRWLLAVAARDEKVLAKTSAASLGPVGLDPARYASLYDEGGFSTITAKEVPPELEAHAAVLARLVKTGHALVWFTSDDERGATNVVLAIKAGKVVTVVEAMTAK